MNTKAITMGIRRAISGIVASAIALSSIPAMAAENEKYPYTLFAASSEDGAITTTAYNFCVNGNVCTNGTIVANGNLNVNGTKTENAGQDMIYIFDKIDTKYFTTGNVDEHTEDYVLDEINININVPTEVLGETELTGNININTALKSFEDINLFGEVKNTNDSVIYSKYGDVIIDSTNVNLNGLVYAPFGNVEITAQNLNLNNVVIIADRITLDCPNVNANYSTNAGELVGTVSEALNIPKEEWQYMKDENGNGLPDFFEDFENWEKLADTDGDGLPDSIEEYLGSDANNIDTDNDGLNDYYEIFGTYTDPTKADTDENGVDDGEEDFDEDGLTNLGEFLSETYPYTDDTDCDGLSDGDEVNVYITDPLIVDTDGEGLLDGDEIVLGTDPLVQDTDADGRLDCDEKFNQTFTHKVANEDCAVTEVSVTMDCTGNINRTTTIDSVMNIDILCSDVVGLVGEPFEIKTTSEFDTATLTFTIDKSKLGDTEFDSLMFLWYNEEENKFVELETTLDEENSTASIVTTHFSKYMVIDKYQWFEAWAVEFDYNPTGGASGAPSIPVKYNTVLAIDCSGSMVSNDLISIKSGFNSGYESQHPYTCNRITAAEGFINYMDSSDETAIVFFTGSADEAASMTNDKEALKLALQKMKDGGGTSFSAALYESIDQIDNAHKITNGANKNRIILLSDGDDGDSARTRNLAIQACKSKYIEVYTVGFGRANDEILQDIADETGGKYYKAMSADDIVGIFAKIGYMDDFDMTDTDGDGLPDAVEAAGIRLQNGHILKDVDPDGIIFTDPNKPDTDGDGLLDGEEIDPTPQLHAIPEFALDPSFSGPVQSKPSYYFTAISDPRKKDSDGDGYADGPIDSLGNGKYNDPDPLICNTFVYKLSESDTYVNADGKYGGNQSWIKGNAIYPNNDIYSSGGCAIAAACDFLIYSEMTNPKYAGLTGLPDINNITKAQYVNYYYNIGSTYVKPVEFLEYKENLEKILSSSKDAFTYSTVISAYMVLKLITDGTYTWGVMPWDYPGYINDACSSMTVQQIDLVELSLSSDLLSKMEWWNGIKSLNIERMIRSQSIKPAVQEQLIMRIKNSLSNDCPVTLCYGLNSDYTFYTDTKLTSPYGTEIRKAPHYVNMTEYVIDTIANEEYITIASWGERLYIDPKQVFQGHGIGGSLFFYET